MSPRCRLLAVSVAVLAGCDVTITLGHNDAGLVGPLGSCEANAPIRACGNDACVVSQLATPDIGRETIATDAEYVYFITGERAVGRVSKAGGPVTTLTPSVEGLERISIDAQDLYWTVFNGTVFRAPKDGSAAPSVATELMANPVSIANDETYLYLAMPGSGEVAMAPKPAGPVTLLSGQGTPVDLAVDAEHVYWIDQGQPGGATGRLVRAPRGDLARNDVLLTDLEEPLALGLTRDAILWATFDAVFRLPRTGGSTESFTGDFGEPKGITEIDGVLYLASATGLHRIELGGGPTRVLDARGMTALTLDCDGLFASGWFVPIVVRYGP